MATKILERSNPLIVGSYSIPEASRIVHAPVGMVRRWAAGHSLAGPKKLSGATAKLMDASPDQKGMLAFRDLVELLFVSLFRRQGLSLQSIRKAAQAATREFGIDYPFTVKRFDTDGKRIFATLAENDQELREELLRGQFVFPALTEPLFRQLDYSDLDLAKRYWPWGKRGGIVLDPAIDFGAPLVARRGIPTYDLLLAWNANRQDVDTVAYWYEVTPAEVELAVKYEQSLRKQDA